MTLFQRIKEIVIGKPKNLADQRVFHSISLIALFAWVGLGADGLSSSCYGPEQTFLVLQQYPSLSIFVALAMAITIFIISESYQQIIELFPHGGGGYLVASKLLSPTVGMVSGCALLIDYVLTISISVASGIDALYSFFPVEWLPYKVYAGIGGVVLLMLMNMRGVRESIIPLVPVFMTFIVTHFFAIIYGLIVHASDFPAVASAVGSDLHKANAEIGLVGIVILILRSYSMGAGTYTGIEAVSNGLPILREPKVLTAKKTMNYMAYSLAFTATGLMILYLLYNVSPHVGKTLNAVLFDSIVAHWPAAWACGFILVTLLSEALLLFVAAQTGFVGGPRVLANMATDRWFPTKFAGLSDRLVMENGVLLMSLTAIVTIFFTHGDVHILVVLYSINVFISFCLSQLGVVRYWWNARHESKKWKKKIFINGLGLSLTSFILLSVVILKFHDGGWITIIITGALILLALMIKKHYRQTATLLNRLNNLVDTVLKELSTAAPGKKDVAFDPTAKTAVMLVNGFNGLGLHTLFGVIRLFGGNFKNFVFVEIGVIDAGNFKGVEEVDNLKTQVSKDMENYVAFMQNNGYYAQGYSAVGIDVIGEVEKISAQVVKKYPNCVFFGGQLVFAEETFWNRLLHNYTVFTFQRKFYQQGIPFVLVPIRV